MKQKKLFSVGLLLVILAAGLSAQLTNKKREKPPDPTIRSLEGVVRDADDKIVSGAVVKLKNLKTLQIRSFITQSDGRYTFQSLSKSIDYEVVAEHDGASSPTRTLSVFDDRTKAVINLKLESKKS
ncbi:MAG: carboxypeptidase-like regulatory domain-containing protein [Bryobacteraceae bacterium]